FGEGKRSNGHEVIDDNFKDKINRVVERRGRVTGSGNGRKVVLVGRQWLGIAIGWSILLVKVNTSIHNIIIIFGSWVRRPSVHWNAYCCRISTWLFYLKKLLRVRATYLNVMQMSKVLGEQLNSGHPVWPVAIHGHYTDAGDSAGRLSGALNIPMLFTGHSLGQDKLEQLLRQGRLTKDEINTTYKIMRRVEAEESSLDSSEVVITSTRQEIDEQ
ncbi:sucrose-phosphate synthase-like, partial [Helianthus annuus]|uniref:sucrose-phosphate synthase-like n=1 Tax=Helianthus annuus TaxID=4232 RepID=UPI001652EB59